MSDKKKVLPLKNMPDSIRAIILKRQVDEKIKCNCTRSMEWTIYAIIRDWEEHQKQIKFLDSNGLLMKGNLSHPVEPKQL